MNGNMDLPLYAKIFLPPTLANAANPVAIAKAKHENTNTWHTTTQTRLHRDGCQRRAPTCPTSKMIRCKHGTPAFWIAVPLKDVSNSLKNSWEMKSDKNGQKAAVVCGS